MPLDWRKNMPVCYFPGEVALSELSEEIHNASLELVVRSILELSASNAWCVVRTYRLAEALHTSVSHMSEYALAKEKRGHLVVFPQKPAQFGFLGWRIILWHLTPRCLTTEFVGIAPGLASRLPRKKAAHTWLGKPIASAD